AWLAAHDAIHCLDEFRRRQHGVVTLVHRRRARMILESTDGHFPLLDPDDSFDDADVEAVALERPALLDMQLEIGGDVAALPSRLDESRRIAAEERDP